MLKRYEVYETNNDFGYWYGWFEPGFYDELLDETIHETFHVYSINKTKWLN